MDRRRITANMRIRDILATYPVVLPVLHRYGITCADCHAARYESLGQGARVHAIDLGRLLTDLNRAAGGGRSLAVGAAPRDRASVPASLSTPTASTHATRNRTPHRSSP